MEEYFVLGEDGEPRRETDVESWTQWFEHADRNIARTIVLPHVTVLTTFSGVYNPVESDSAPRLFETRVFGGVLDGEEITSASRAEAVAAHSDLAEWCRIGNASDAGVTKEMLA